MSRSRWLTALVLGLLLALAAPLPASAGTAANVTEHVDAVTGGHSHEEAAGYVVNAKGEMCR